MNAMGIRVDVWLCFRTTEGYFVHSMMELNEMNGRNGRIMRGVVEHE